MKIGIFTSSVPIGVDSPKRGLRAKTFLESKGHEVILGDLFDKKDFYRSGSIQERAKEINNLIDQDVDVLMASIGGYVTNTILPYINFQKINEKKIIVTGFSDITALLNAVIVRCPEARAFYGPGFFKGFGNFEEEFNEFTYKTFINQVNKKSEIECEMPEYWNEEMLNWEDYEKPKTMIKNEWKTINKDSGIIEGILKGGNLSTLQGIWGSEFQPKFTKNDILFIEDACYNPETIERFFGMLKLNGILENVKAIILGKHELFKDQGTGRKPIDVLKEVLNNHLIPVIYDVDFCHTNPMSIIEMNVLTKIDFTKKKIYQS